jgi:hypothetical protein
VSLLNAVECYPCREVSLNHGDSLLFHGGDTGSTPVRDANYSYSYFNISRNIRLGFCADHTDPLSRNDFRVIMNALCYTSR